MNTVIHVQSEVEFTDLWVEPAAENCLENVDLFEGQLAGRVVLVLDLGQVVGEAELQVLDRASDVGLVTASCRLRFGASKYFPGLRASNITT